MGFWDDGSAQGTAAVANSAVNIATTGFDVWNADRNYEFAKKQFEYNKEMAQLTREREDTSYQRRVADLKAAGLHPTLAAGSPGASATPVSSNVTPHSQNLGAGRIAVDSASLLAMAQVRQMNAQTEQIKTQTGLLERDYHLRERQTDATVGLSEAQQHNLYIGADKLHEERNFQVIANEIYERFGVTEKELALTLSRIAIDRGRIGYKTDLEDYEITKINRSRSGVGLSSDLVNLEMLDKDLQFYNLNLGTNVASKLMPFLKQLITGRSIHNQNFYFPKR